MKIPKLNYTQVPNDILDSMANFTDAELRLVLCLCRETFGWQKLEAKLSNVKLAELTGMSQQGVINAMKTLLEDGVVERRPAPLKGYQYRLAVEDNSPVNAVDPNGVDPSTALTGKQGSPVNGVDCSIYSKEKDFKEREAAPPHPKEPDQRTQFAEGWCSLYKEKFGQEYLGFKLHPKREWPCASNLVKVLSASELLTLAADAWSKPTDRKFWNCNTNSRTVPQLAAALDKIRSELLPASGSPAKDWNNW